MNSADQPRRSGRLRRWLPSLRRKEKAMDPVAQDVIQDRREKYGLRALPDPDGPKGAEDVSPPEQQKRWPQGRSGIRQEIREQRPPSQSSNKQTPRQQNESPDWHHRDQRSENHREERYTRSNPYVDWEPGRSPPERANHGVKKQGPRQEYLAKSRSDGDRRRNPDSHQGTPNHSNAKGPASSQRRRLPGPDAPQVSRQTSNQRPPR